MAIVELSRRHLLWLACLGSLLRGGSAIAAEPSLREESRRVRAGEPFEIALPVRAGTGSTWILRVAPPEVTVLSQARRPSAASAEAGTEQQFLLVASQGGDYSLRWELAGRPGVVYSVFRLALHVDRAEPGR